jgi:hypothetical protein
MPNVNVITDLAADELEEVACTVGSNDQQLHGFVVLVDDNFVESHVESVGDVFNHAAVLQGG